MSEEISHPVESLAAYSAGALDEQERPMVAKHVAECEVCRADMVELTALTETLGEVPPEFFLDGPPDNELPLYRTLRTMRTERARLGRPRTAAAIGLAAAALVATFVGGTALGHNHGATTAAPATVTVSPAPTAPLPGSRFLQASANGAELTAEVQKRNGWVWVNASMIGLPNGDHCQLFVVGKDGRQILAGSWPVTTAALNIDGTADIPIDDVAAVQVRNTAGVTVVSAPL